MKSAVYMYFHNELQTSQYIYIPTQYINVPTQYTLYIHPYPVYLHVYIPTQYIYIPTQYIHMYIVYLIATILEETDQENSHDHYNGYEDSSINQGKTKRLNTTGRFALIKWKIVTTIQIIIISKRQRIKLGQQITVQQETLVRFLVIQCKIAKFL